MDFAGAPRLGPGEDNPEVVSVAVEGSREVVKGILVPLEGRRAVRRGRMHGCRRASRSGLLTALGVRSSVVGQQVLCSGLDHCRHLMADPEVLGFVAGAVRQVGP